MEVQANSAGTQALKDTLNCLLGEGVVTHSSMILNTMSAYKVRTNDLEKDSVIYDLSSVVLPGDGVRYAKFLSQSTYDTAMVPLTAYGSYDATYTWTTDSITCRATEACGDYCVEECTPPDPTGCECAGAESGCIVDLNNVVASTASYMEI